MDSNGRHDATDGDSPDEDPVDAVPGYDVSRRRLLGATGALALAGLAGCSGSSGGDGGGSDGGDGGGCSTPPEDLGDTVPGEYEGAESKGGLSRKPSKLLTKEEANYEREPNGDQQCSKCAYYVPDKNGDCAGACVRVGGMIDPSGYCDYYRTKVGGGW
ncbi:MAG: hypothetical protein ABEJ40_05325 [Haloarculaceae archaeon]